MYSPGDSGFYFVLCNVVAETDAFAKMWARGHSVEDLHIGRGAAHAPMGQEGGQEVSARVIRLADFASDVHPSSFGTVQEANSFLPSNTWGLE